VLETENAGVQQNMNLYTVFDDDTNLFLSWTPITNLRTVLFFLLQITAAQTRMGFGGSPDIGQVGERFVMVLDMQPTRFSTGRRTWQPP
jgi:hypothetical protein